MCRATLAKLPFSFFSPMESNYASLALPCILFLIFFSSVSSDINQDKEKCANQLVGLATCLPYVSGEAKVPTVDCCTGLKQVLKNSKECLCILVKDRNDPSLGLKLNATLALSLPDTCHAPANVSQCPALLHLPPNSPEAKIFEDFAHSSSGSNSSAPTEASTAKGSSASAKSDGGKRGWMRIEMLVGFLIASGVHVLIIN